MIAIKDYVYDKKDRLGHGVQGITFKGYKGQNPVTIKILAEDEEGNNEIDTLEKLYETKEYSPYVMRYYENFIFEDETYIILEYIDGTTLEDMTITPSMISQLLLGLKFIHDRGCAHRDIRPKNIMLTVDNTIKYIDFGQSCVKECPYKTECTSQCFELDEDSNPLDPEKSTLISQSEDVRDLYEMCKALGDPSVKAFVKKINPKMTINEILKTFAKKVPQEIQLLSTSCIQFKTLKISISK